jgi:AcrR family transcriptional regulator
MAVRVSRAESKAATRAELLDAARRVFLERGFHGASLELVAREAGYTKGAVYSAFTGKADLFLAVYDREMDRRRSEISVVVSEALARGDESADEAAREFFRRLRAQREWTLALLEFRLHAARHAEVNAAWSERHRAFVAWFAETVITPFAGRALGVPDALAAIAMSNGYALEHLALPEEADEEAYVEGLSMLWEGLRR